MRSPPESLALSIIERLRQAEHVAYLAGGCVRDRLMGRVPKDYDVATSARPEQVLKLFPHSQQVGIAFGVVLVRERRTGGAAHVEVATFRADGAYSDGRRPDSVRFTDAREDAQRRDFTCNGLFLDPLANGGQGEIHDFVGGRADIAAKILRAIGQAEHRFAEDHLRMLRAIRFAGKLGFSIEAETFAAMRRHAGEIRTVSKERVHDELALILGHVSRGTAVKLLQATGLLEPLWPKELLERPDMARDFAAVEALPPEADFVMTLAALHKDISSLPAVHAGEIPAPMRLPGAAVAELLRQAFLLSNVETADIAWLLEGHAKLLGWESFSKATFKRLLADPRWPRLAMLFIHLSLDPLRRAIFEARVAERSAEGVAPSPLIKGNMLIAMGAPPGPAFRRWLEELYDRQLEGELRTEAEAVAAARKLVEGK